MKNSTNQHASHNIGLSAVVDVFDQTELFEILDNTAVLNLSQLGGRSGFRDVRTIRKSTGTSCRRLLRTGVEPVDVAEALCRQLEAASGTTLADFHSILLCHSHTDPEQCQVLAQLLADRMEMPAGTVTAFNHGCAGFLKLMAEGCLLLDGCAAGTKVALLSVETPEFWHDGADRLFCGIVSAGATAAVLEVGRGLSMDSVSVDDFLIPTSRRTNPHPLFTKDTGDVFDFRANAVKRTVMRMNPEPVFLNGIELMLDNLRAALLTTAWQPGDRVVVAPHQPSGKLLKALVAAARTEFPEIEFLNNLEHYGNTISSSVPTLLSRLDEVLQRNRLEPLLDGDHLILLAAGICMNEISNHMSAGHACTRWQNGVLNVQYEPASSTQVFAS